MEDNKVTILLEDLMSQFHTFGESLQLMNEKMEREFMELQAEVREMKEQNRQEHPMLKYMLQDVVTDQVEMQKKFDDLDQEFEIKLRPIK